MKKEYILYLLIIIFIFVITGCGKNEKQKSNIAGLYHTNSWGNNREATLRLNSDATCQYPLSSYICNWTYSSEYIISLELSEYKLRYSEDEKNKEQTIPGTYYSKIQCEEDRLNKWKDQTNSLKCVLQQVKKENAEIIDTGILLNNHIFTKISSN